MHLHIHTTIVTPSSQLRFKSLVKVDVKPTDNLREVLSQHDENKKESKYKILKYWDGRNKAEPSNRVSLHLVFSTFSHILAVVSLIVLACRSSSTLKMEKQILWRRWMWK